MSTPLPLLLLLLLLPLFHSLPFLPLLLPMPQRVDYSQDLNAQVVIDVSHLELVVKCFGGMESDMQSVFDEYREEVWSRQIYHGQVQRGLDVDTLSSLQVHLTNHTQSLTDPEEYQVSLSLHSASISCLNYVSFLRALETLSQVFKQFGTLLPGGQVMLTRLPIFIEDGSVLSYRGLMVDTARHFIPMATLKQIVRTMQYSKLNVFHWHITDSETFPLQLYSQPQQDPWHILIQAMSHHTTSPHHTYSTQQVQELRSYAAKRGVRVLAEIDAPAHTHSWGRTTSLQDLVMCRHQPCPAPPCGQLNLAHPLVYVLLEKVYNRAMDLFPDDYFHIGGDEVVESCYMQDQGIKAFMQKNFLANFTDLMDYYMEKVRKITGERRVVRWVQLHQQFSSKDGEILQYWGKTNEFDAFMERLPQDQQVIFSAYDSLYLDCGTHNIYGQPSWCNYNTWRNISQLNYTAMVEQYPGLIGFEVPLWSEVVDQHNIQTILFPRAYVMADRVWHHPHEDQQRSLNRFLFFREVLLERGLTSAPLTSQYYAHHPLTE